MKTIDLRSDTVTLPTPEMLKAISQAELGDDVFGEDATTNRLEKMAAEKLGKEAALLVPSGAMANLVSVLTHCARGDEAILGDNAHMFLYECGSMSAVGGIGPHTIPNQPDGTLRPDDIKGAIRGSNIHFPRTRLICLENTHNRCEGAVLDVAYMDEVAAIASEYGLAIHLDGARIFNASVALGVDVKELARRADSVSFCLSKGLSAPVGSLICGSADFIGQARRNRKLLGGGMRQCGIIAAAGIVALEQMIERLAEDHDNARLLAEGIARIKGLAVDLSRVKSNMVYFELKTDGIADYQLVERLAERGVKFLAVSRNRFRMVTHYGIETADIYTALKELATVVLS